MKQLIVRISRLNTAVMGVVTLAQSHRSTTAAITATGIQLKRNLSWIVFIIYTSTMWMALLLVHPKVLSRLIKKEKNLIKVVD